MSAKFEFYLSDDDYERLYSAKRSKGKSDMTDNEFAKELLEINLHMLHPGKVRYDENDNEIE